MAMAYIKIFFNWLEVTRLLSHEEKGRLIDAMVCYARDGSGEDLLTGSERVLFPQFQAHIDNAAAKYARACEEKTSHAGACLRNQESRIEESRIEERRIEEEDQEMNPTILQKIDENWRTSGRARGAAAQLLVDHCISENLPCSGMNSLFDELLSAMEGGLSPAELLSCCQRADARSLGLEIYTAMKRRGVGVRA